MIIYHQTERGLGWEQRGATWDFGKIEFRIWNHRKRSWLRLRSEDWPVEKKPCRDSVTHWQRDQETDLVHLQRLGDGTGEQGPESGRVILYAK